MYLGLGTSEVGGPHCLSPGQSPSPSLLLCLPPLLPTSFSFPFFPLFLLSHQPSLFVVCLRGTELRFGARRLRWRDTGTSGSGHSCEFTSQSLRSDGMYLVEALRGQHGGSQRVAHLRSHKYWVTFVHHANLRLGDNSVLNLHFYSYVQHMSVHYLGLMTHKLLITSHKPHLSHLTSHFL